jgi:hypothetical protein
MVWELESSAARWGQLSSLVSVLSPDLAARGSLHQLPLHCMYLME